MLNISPDFSSEQSSFYRLPHQEHLLEATGSLGILLNKGGEFEPGLACAVGDHGRRTAMNEHPVLLFDGVCNLCSTAAQFIIKRDSGDGFRFAAMQSPAGERLLTEHRLADLTNETMVLIVDRSIYLRSDAVLEIARRLDGAWSLLRCFSLLPRSWREAVYRRLAGNRFRWFGRRRSCLLPSEENRQRFLV